MYFILNKQIILIFFFSALLSTACSKSSKHIDTSINDYTRAKQLFYDGKYSETIDIIENGQFTLKKGHQGILLLAKSYFLLLQPDKSYDLTKKLLRKYPSYIDAQLWHIRSCLALEYFNEAEKNLQKAIEFNHEDFRFLQLYASLYETQKNYHKSLEYLNQACIYIEDLGKMELKKAIIYYRHNQIESAAFHIDRASNIISHDSILFRSIEKLKGHINLDKLE